MALRGEAVSTRGMGQDSKEARKASSIMNMIRKSSEDTTSIRARWRLAWDMFVNGSTFEDKADWQSQFSTGKSQSLARSAQAELVSILLQNPEWWSFERKVESPEVVALEAPLRKAMNFFLDISLAKRHFATFILNSIVNIGSLYVGWKKERVTNPEWLLVEAKKSPRIASGDVVNPDVPTQPSGEELANQLSELIDDVIAEAQDKSPAELVSPKIPQYIEQGMLDFRDVHFEGFFWDNSVHYMEDSPWKAFSFDVPKYVLEQWARAGKISKARLKKIVPGSMTERDRLRRVVTSESATVSMSKDLVQLTLYFGPLVVDGEVERDNYYALIANGSVILKDGEPPFWEPLNRKTPVINLAVRQVPFRAAGAGMTDSIIELERQLDSNYQLICDSYRIGIAGINFVDYHSFVDKGSLEEGLEPGKLYQVRGDPRKVFYRQDLTNNIESQVSPINTVLASTIEEVGGISDLLKGVGNLRSRTTAKEVDARLQGSQRTVSIVAIDLEQNFLIPILETCFARVLQFGLAELNSNPAFRAIFTEDELLQLQSLTVADRFSILTQFYRFRINGFSARQNDNELLMRLNELLQIASANPILNALTNWPEVIKLWVRLAGDLDKQDLLILKNTEVEAIMAENSVLMANNIIEPKPEDNHEMHMSLHQPLANSEFSSPALQDHINKHMQLLQQMQLLNQPSMQNVQ